MKRIFTWVFIVIPIISFCQSQQLKKEISGNVKEYMSGEPIAGAKVELFFLDSTSISITTDSKGDYIFEASEKNINAMIVMASAKGYKSLTAKMGRSCWVILSTSVKQDFVLGKE